MEMRAGGAFRAYVREVFAKHSVRWPSRRTKQAHFLHGLVQFRMPRAEQRWEGEGGHVRKENSGSDPSKAEPGKIGV
ncbi:MAG TPA: hypothetical protein VJQ58_05890 [Burkholderiales bacterium]|nr:hypothetical protein [Burkholderiales bacterium]